VVRNKNHNFAAEKASEARRRAINLTPVGGSKPPRVALFVFDMALMALKHSAEKIVLVAGDSDFIAPIKFIRKEGLQAYLYSMGHKVKSPLKEHCDFVLS
jgi:hypothetical protein